MLSGTSAYARPARVGIVLAALASLAGAVPHAATASDAVVAPLMARDVVGTPGKEVTLETVEYAPASDTAASGCSAAG